VNLRARGQASQVASRPEDKVASRMASASSGAVCLQAIEDVGSGLAKRTGDNHRELIKRLKFSDNIEHETVRIPSVSTSIECLTSLYRKCRGVLSR